LEIEKYPQESNGSETYPKKGGEPPKPRDLIEGIVSPSSKILIITERAEGVQNFRIALD